MFMPASADTPVPVQPFFRKMGNSYIDLTKISCIRWIMLGSFFRFWGYACVLAFQFTFFNYFNQP